MDDNSLEKFPGSSVEKSGERVLSESEDFSKAFSEGVPEFAGNKFGIANNENKYYGEKVEDIENDDEQNEGVDNASAIINYGLNAAARELGVELVVQRIKGFDAAGSENPINSLFESLGVDTIEEKKDVEEEASAAAVDEDRFRSETSMPNNKNKSKEGALLAIQDMKELISEVEGADPRYEELREGARAAGKGYFEYAVQNYGVRGLTELFKELKNQREKKKEEETDDEKQENADEQEGVEGQELTRELDFKELADKKELEGARLRDEIVKRERDSID